MKQTISIILTIIAIVGILIACRASRDAPISSIAGSKRYLETTYVDACITNIADLPSIHPLSHMLSRALAIELTDEKNRVRNIMSLIQHELFVVNMGDVELRFRIDRVYCRNRKNGEAWNAISPSYERELERSPHYREIVDYAINNTREFRTIDQKKAIELNWHPFFDTRSFAFSPRSC